MVLFSLPLGISMLVCRSCFTHSSTCFVILPKVRAGLYFLLSSVIINFDTLDPKSGEEEERDRIRSQVITAPPRRVQERGHGHRHLECEPDFAKHCFFGGYYKFPNDMFLLRYSKVERKSIRVGIGSIWVLAPPPSGLYSLRWATLLLQVLVFSSVKVDFYYFQIPPAPLSEDYTSPAHCHQIWLCDLLWSMMCELNWRVLVLGRSFESQCTSQWPAYFPVARMVFHSSLGPCRATLKLLLRWRVMCEDID